MQFSGNTNRGGQGRIELVDSKSVFGRGKSLISAASEMHIDSDSSLKS